MSHPCCAPLPRDGSGTGRHAVDVADVLAHAASPVFTAMAGTTWLLGNDQAAVLCMGQPASFVGGMPAMYLLMAALHAGPWLRKTVRRGEARRPAAGRER
jgi:hypothetical protein